jgi:biopolymer transport protein ExbD
MAMQVGPADGGDDSLNSTINTTPLVDVMLVLLIIFLITVPVITKTVPVRLPQQINIPTQTKPENIVIAVDKDGNTYWNDARIQTEQVLTLVEDANRRAVDLGKAPPEVHIRADRQVRYEYVGRIVVYCQQGGTQKVGFILEPPVRGS